MQMLHLSASRNTILGCHHPSHSLFSWGLVGSISPYICSFLLHECSERSRKEAVDVVRGGSTVGWCMGDSYSKSPVSSSPTCRLLSRKPLALQSTWTSHFFSPPLVWGHSSYGTFFSLWKSLHHPIVCFSSINFCLSGTGV